MKGFVMWTTLDELDYISKIGEWSETTKTSRQVVVTGYIIALEKRTDFGLLDKETLRKAALRLLKSISD